MGVVVEIGIDVEFLFGAFVDVLGVFAEGFGGIVAPVTGTMEPEVDAVGGDFAGVVRNDVVDAEGGVILAEYVVDVFVEPAWVAKFDGPALLG